MRPRFRIRPGELNTWNAFAAARVAVLVSVAVAAGTRSAGQTVVSTWLSDLAAGAGNWSNNLLWTLQPATNGARVSIANGLLFPAYVNVDVSSNLADLSLGAGATLAVGSGHLLDLSAASTLQGTLVNTGIVRASGGARVTLQTGAVDNTGGTLSALNGSTLAIAGITVTAGNVSTSGTGVLELAGATLAGVSVTNSPHGIVRALSGVNLLTGTYSDAAGSEVRIADGATIVLPGGAAVVINGGIHLDSSGTTTTLEINSGTLAVSGPGELVLSDRATNRVTGSGTNPGIALGVAFTVAGAGLLGNGSLDFTQQGTIIANGSNALIVDQRGASFTNQGTLKATGTGGMTLADASVTHQGNIEISEGSALRATGNFTQSGPSSVTRLDGGTFSSAAFFLTAGSLNGSGTVNGAVGASGDAVIRPGGAGAAGTLTFNQRLTLGPTNRLLFDLGGLAAGTGYDRIEGTEVVANGTLAVAFINGFQATIPSTATFTLISASTAITGTFSGLAEGARFATTDGFGTFQVNYLPHALTLSNFQAVPEPSTWALLGAGTIAIAWADLRRRRRER